VGLSNISPKYKTHIRNGRADIVLLAREFLCEPYWPRLAARALGHNSLLKYPTERRVRAHGLHYFLVNHGSCRPGALTGRVFQQADKDAVSAPVQYGRAW
jgi:hypothetical protein